MKRPTFLILLGMPGLWCGLAVAHALPERSFPAPNTVLTQAPATVTIYFDSKLEPVFSHLVVKNAQGTTISEGTGGVAPGNPKVLATKLPAVAKGAYRVYWDVVSRDGHRANGDYTFTVK